MIERLAIEADRSQFIIVVCQCHPRWQLVEETPQGRINQLSTKVSLLPVNHSLKSPVTKGIFSVFAW